MNRYLLNIGLLESTLISDGRSIPAEVALETVRRTVSAMFYFGGHVTAHAVHDSDSEPTLIVEVTTTDPFHNRVRMLADALCSQLRQEAIAIAELNADGCIKWGDLRGPMADRWGSFNPEFFLLLDGSRAA